MVNKFGNIALNGEAADDKKLKYWRAVKANIQHFTEKRLMCDKVRKKYLDSKLSLLE